MGVGRRWWWGSSFVALLPCCPLCTLFSCCWFIYMLPRFSHHRVLVALTGLNWKWFQSQPIAFSEIEEAQKTGKERQKKLHSSLLICPHAKKQEINIYQLAVGIIWWLEPWCIVNVINMHLCLSLPCPLCLLFYQMLFHRNARAIKIHVKLSGMKEGADTVFFAIAGA